MKERLREYGLSEKEIEVYLTCIKAGDCTANKLSEMTTIRRSTVYEVIETLKKKGLIKSFKKDKKTYFAASKPTTLIDILKEKERIINEILPDLNAITNSSKDKPKVNLLEGVSSIKAEVQKMLASKDILVYGASIAGDKTYGTFTENFARKRITHKVHLKAIIGKEIPDYMQDPKTSRLTEVRKLREFDNYSVAYFIYADNILILTAEEPLIAISINSSLISKTQKDIFQILWKIAEK